MGSRAIHQLPQVTDQDSTDVMYGVRYNAGSPENFSIPRIYIGSDIKVVDAPTIASAQVLTLFTTSQPLVFGTVGKIIIPDKVIVTMTGGTIDYATNTQLIVGEASSIDNTHYTLTGALPLVAFPTTVLFPGFSITGEVSSIASGENLHIRMKTGNPTAGDGDLEIQVFYYLIDG